ncbi:phosphoadenosine phosphosulfate reductase family protein [Megasphaera stantonii]|uniref:phosphoadenosine phosphosulfate reductase domain-containing protein n=1 Tax=Megasphaera stantonii TaxID=2144175 RepID=UPI001D2D721E|nr:phosphoadenosine phosphosulfate reductase family protein [Megasphaera stantonii]MBM6731829.1 phosphoadenosine phosphosulfate reductase family protein [Megasphaera stantonii]
MKSIVQFSGGKDSTCMLLMMLERGMQIDDIIFCDTTMEFPAMYEHIDKVEKYIGRPITRLKPPHDFIYYFAQYPKKRGKNKGKLGYGWPRMWARWCTRLFKIDLTAKYLRCGSEYKLYIGIARDEPKRPEKRMKNVIHPLYDWGITESMALQYCYNHGFDWSGLYEQFRRVSCWCCPLQPLNELRELRKFHPELWRKLLKMDDMVEHKFKPDWSVRHLEQRFAMEDRQQQLF